MVTIPAVRPRRITVKVIFFSTIIRGIIEGELIKTQLRSPPPTSAKGAKVIIANKIFSSLSFLHKSEQLRELRKETRKIKRTV